MHSIERQWRLISGLIVALYLFQHLLGLWPGIVSFDLMERARELQSMIWRSLPGTIALYGALLSHLGLALVVLYRRRSFRMPAWEAAQLCLGLAVPFLLVGHVMGTRLANVLFDVETPYRFVVNVLWNNEWYRYRQILLLVVAWAHVSIGLHYWLRLRAGYRRWFPLAYGGALIVPVLALAGFLRAGVETTRWSAQAEERNLIADVITQIGAAGIETVNRSVDATLWGLLGLYLCVLTMRQVRRWRDARGAIYLYHPDCLPIPVQRGQTVLETLRAHRIPHASVCGGRARCTTCRVRLGVGCESMKAPAEAESAALARIAAAGNVRLACQLRPDADIHITPLLPADTDTVPRGGVAGREQQVVAMFVDLRGSTALGEQKLPYDVVFVLNRFFAEMSEALDATNGHYAQFAGDGLLALYGLNVPVEEACLAALTGALEMARRAERLSEHLKDELASPLRIGVGVHVGEAIVGTMGPPSSPNLSAVGDNINVAARLESLSKDYGCIVVSSLAVFALAGIDPAGFPPHRAAVRGRLGAIDVLAIHDLALLQQRLPAIGGQ